MIKGRKVDIKSKYLARWSFLSNSSFANLVDNISWNALENKDDKIYLVTSASLSEGKTTVAVNLAINIAKTGKKVLLIDANLRNPAIGEIFDARELPGLTRITCNGMSMEDIIFPIESYKISIIPTGNIDREPFEILTSPKMAETLAYAKKNYDFVIVDCTAVNFYADPLLLCSLVDQVVFVILADKTEKSEVLIAKAKILNSRGKILGIVLNRESFSFFL